MNKRFTVPDKYSLSHSKVQLNGEPLTNDEIVRVLNVNDGAFVENLNLKKENKELKQENEQMKSKGLKVLEFYEYKLKNAAIIKHDKKEFDNAREELWIVKEVLCEMGVIKDE